MQTILRLATLSVQTLGKRLSRVLTLLAAMSVDVAAIQEARITPICFPAVARQCAVHGYEAHMSDYTKDDEGRVTGGCLNLS